MRGDVKFPHVQHEICRRSIVAPTRPAIIVHHFFGEIDDTCRRCRPVGDRLRQPPGATARPGAGASVSYLTTLPATRLREVVALLSATPVVTGLAPCQGQAGGLTSGRRDASNGSVHGAIA